MLKPRENIFLMLSLIFDLLNIFKVLHNIHNQKYDRESEKNVCIDSFPIVFLYNITMGGIQVPTLCTGTMIMKYLLHTRKWFISLSMDRSWFVS